MANNFLTKWPIHKADACFLRWILHNGPDKYCIEILRNLNLALKPSTMIIVSDRARNGLLDLCALTTTCSLSASSENGIPRSYQGVQRKIMICIEEREKGTIITPISINNLLAAI